MQHTCVRAWVERDGDDVLVSVLLCELARDEHIGLFSMYQSQLPEPEQYTAYRKTYKFGLIVQLRR